MSYKKTMARLIDAEPILMRWNTESLGRKEMYEMVKNAPTVDAVPVVRCKNCTYYCPLDDSRPYDCLRSGFLCVRKEDFCSCGKERR